MTEMENLNYFLFPHMALSRKALRNLCLFTPRLNVLEIAGRAQAPEWAGEKICGWPVLSGEASARIGSCIEGYRTFAQVHGGIGGILGFLNSALDEAGESRYRIQEALREECPPGMDAAQREITRAALFLEIARELDEKELEIESSYAHLNAIEQEFRVILGMEDEEMEGAGADIVPPLAPDTNGLLYMLPGRIESWFRMLSLKPPGGIPVFVATFPEVMEEVLYLVRTECERRGKKFSAASFEPGPVPRLEGLGIKQFRSLIEAPDAAELLSSCRREMENFIRSAARGENPDELERRGRSLRDALEGFSRKCEAPEGDEASLGITVMENVSPADIPGLPGPAANREAEALRPVFMSIC